MADPAYGIESSDAARRIAALARWRKRSSLVHFYRRALPAAMAALVLFGVGWVVVRELIAMSASRETVGSIHLLHPVFHGRNDQKQPYIMGATEAVRDGDDPDRIALTLPWLKEFNGDPKPQVVTADRGVYHEKERLLDLYGHVHALDGQGNQFFSAFAHVELNKNTVTGDQAVHGLGPSGTISASSYVVYDKGQHVIFTGNVHTHLATVHNADTKSQSPAAAAAKPQPAAAAAPAAKPGQVR